MRAGIQRVRLGDVCEMSMGQAPDSSSYNEDKEGLPFYQGNADFGKVFPAPRVWCSNPTKVAEPGDLLISVRAPIGALNFANEKCCIGRGLAGIRALHDVEIGYLFYALKSKVQSLNKLGTGSTFKAINKNALIGIDISLPPLAEQKRIAVKLDLLCEIISKREEQLVKLKQLAKSRFVEMFGDAIWPKTTIGELSEFLTSGSRGWAKYYSDEGELFITIKNVKNTRISFDDVQHIVPPQGAEADRTRVREGDLLISITADLGRTGVVTDEIASRGAYINQHLTRISLKRNVVDPLYAAFYIESPGGKEQIERHNQSAVKAGLNFESIRSIQLPLPPIGKQRQFSAFIEQLDKSEFAIRKSLEAYRKLYRQQVQEVFG